MMAFVILDYRPNHLHGFDPIAAILKHTSGDLGSLEALSPAVVSRSFWLLGAAGVNTRGREAHLPIQHLLN